MAKTRSRHGYVRVAGPQKISKGNYGFYNKGYHDGASGNRPAYNKRDVAARSAPKKVNLTKRRKARPRKAKRGRRNSDNGFPWLR